MAYVPVSFAYQEIVPASKMQQLSANDAELWDLRGAAVGTIGVPAIIPQNTTSLVVLPFTTLVHPFPASTPLVVEADLTGDLTIGPGTEVRMYLSAGGTERSVWLRNWNTTAGNNRPITADLPVKALVPAGTAIDVRVRLDSVGPLASGLTNGGYSAIAAALTVQWKISAGRV